ncbi:hypothetical protein HDV02_000721 [Globomyces sp. JEL0801]|nr:hypothetical protein HDV02_000721 [Globomyces sp. JEL0801]
MENEVLNQDIVEPENLDDLNDLKDPSYAIGCWNYKTVWSWLLNPFERWVYLARVTITILQVVENMRDRYEARAAEIAETNLAELIQSFPIFWYRTQPPEEKNKPPVIAVVNPKKVTDVAILTCKPIKRFRMFKLFQTRNKTNSEDRQYLSVPEEDAMCAICIGEYRDDDLIRQLGCNHHFHVACIDKWLHIHARCPMCVKDIAQMA